MMIPFFDLILLIVSVIFAIVMALMRQRFNKTVDGIKDEVHEEEEIHYDFGYISVPLEDINLRRLRTLYKLKEAYTIKLVEEKFEKGEMSYIYFMDTLQRSHDIFYEEIVNVDELYSLRFSIDYVDKVNKLKNIVREVEGLMIELAKNKEGVESEFIIDDLRHLKESVKNYGGDINE